jgi:hypothetical protein
MLFPKFVGFYKDGGPQLEIALDQDDKRKIEAALSRNDESWENKWTYD